MVPIAFPVKKDIVVFRSFRNIKFIDLDFHCEETVFGNGRKKIFQMKETRGIIILLKCTENATLK